eukprot:scaffold66096_cov63-Phaeocystis_antarctica.AAC.5
MPHLLYYYYSPAASWLARSSVAAAASPPSTAPVSVSNLPSATLREVVTWSTSPSSCIARSSMHARAPPWASVMHDLEIDSLGL